MHALGNDFVVIDNIRQNFHPTPELIQRWADRRTGIGFDQMLLVEAKRNKHADYFYRIFNADGSEVSQCGNGARCLAQFLHEAKLSTAQLIRVETLTDLLELSFEADGQITVTLGRPQLAPAQIPFHADQQALTYPLTVANQSLEICALSLGNPHCVLQVIDVDHTPVAILGPQLATHPSFPQGTNVGFMQILNPEHIRLRVFERGAGETLACGSGACAAVVAGRLLNLLAERVTVDQPGGRAIVSWPQVKAPIRLTGPAVTVFNGSIEI